MLRPPTKHDMHILVVAAMSAIIRDETDVLVAFSYLTTFGPGFPKGIAVRRGGEIELRKIKARKLLTWLNENGYTDVSVEQLKIQRRAFTQFAGSFDNKEISSELLDEHQTDSDNASHQQNEGGT